MFSQIARFCWGRGDTTNTPPHPPSAVMGRKILRSPARDFPILLSGHGNFGPDSVPPCVYVCTHGQSPGREEMLTPVRHPPPFPQPGSCSCPEHGSAGEPLAMLPFFSVMLLRKGCTLAPSLACLMPLLSILPLFPFE